MRWNLRRTPLCVLCLATLVLNGLTRSITAEESPDDRFKSKTSTKLVGEYTTFGGLNPVVLRGVGLVVALNGTGGDPQPSAPLTQLIDELKRNKVKEIGTLLKSPSTAMVEVRAYLPPLLEKGQTIDVEVIAPPEAEARSLEGGWLMETRLGEHAYVPGQPVLKGYDFAVAEGAVITSSVSRNRADDSPELLRGRVLGGARVTRERELSLELRNSFVGVRNAQRIAESIGKRFHDYEKAGIKRSLAEAKTDHKIVLNVHPRYRDNYPRYLQVVRHVAFQETDFERRVRLQRLQEEIMESEHCESAAFQLEGLGQAGVGVLRSGLKAPLPECRFQAACALAYLGEPEALPVLIDSAQQERAFRVQAFASLATLDDGDAALALRELMNDPTPETRYGAFRALWGLDQRDPFIRGQGLRVDKRGRPEYTLHVLATTGEPLVHATMNKHSEIVVFGAEQKFETPLYLSAGRSISIAAQAGEDRVVITRYKVGEQDVRQETPLTVAAVIRAVADLGAHYPEVVQMLVEAERQQNLQGRLAVDALPVAGRTYDRPTTADVPSHLRRARIGKEGLTPNLFAVLRDANQPREETPPPAEPALGSVTTKDEAAPQPEMRETDQRSTKPQDIANPPAENFLQGSTSNDVRESTELKPSRPKLLRSWSWTAPGNSKRNE